MIIESELLLEEGTPLSISADCACSDTGMITVMARPAKGSRRVDVEVRAGQQSWVEKEFAEVQFEPTAGRVRPVLPIVCFRENGSTAVLLGGSRWLSINLLNGHVNARIDLNRSSSEDSGFYRQQFLETRQGFVGIYESGVLAFKPNGELRWHVRKHWDDEFVGERSGELVFMREEKSSFVIDLDTGREREL
ncbi:MAG TPA: hypothetical protein VE057_25700 [Archangium sp.]|nr:hypothetical protein [Archangium sp.]